MCLILCLAPWTFFDKYGNKVNKKKENTYRAEIEKEKYLKKENESFLEKLYNGSTNKLLLNFVEEKKITKKDLEDLLNLIESED